MAEYTGNGLYLKFGTTTLSSDYRSMDSSEEVGLVDSSAGSDANRTYLTTLKDGTASIELVDQSGGTAVWSALAPGTSGTLEWGEEGTATGKPKHSVLAIVKKRDRKRAYDDIITQSFDFQFSGAVTDTVY